MIPTFLKTRISEETWTPLSQKEFVWHWWESSNSRIHLLDPDFHLTTVTRFGLELPDDSIGRSQRRRADPGGSGYQCCLHSDDGDRRYLLRPSCVSDTVAKTHPTAFFHPTWHCLSWLRVLLATNCLSDSHRASGFNFITKLSSIQFSKAPASCLPCSLSKLLIHPGLMDRQPYTRIWMELTLITKQMELEGENVQRQISACVLSV